MAPGDTGDTGDTAPPCDVVIVDDHAMLGEMLAGVLAAMGTPATAITPVAGVDTCAAALAHRPGVVIVDFHLGEAGDASPMIRDLADRQVPVLVLTGDADDLTLARSLEAGAAGVLSKGLPAEHVAGAVRRLAAGERLVGDAQRFEMVSLLRRRRSEEQRRLARYDQLTPREGEVLGLLCDGISAADIAEKCYVSLATVRSQIRAVLMKLGVASQLAAVAAAHRDGWVVRPTSDSSTLTMTATG